MDFLLFLILNGVLFLRPAEIVPALLGLPIYESVILACLATTIPAILEQLELRSLSQRPMTVCILGVALGIVTSHLAHFDTYSAREYGYDFAKIVAFYLLFSGVVRSVERLRILLFVLPLLAVVVVGLAVLVYHEKIDIPALESISEKWTDKETGEEITIWRMRSTGIFNDPNDLSLLLVTSMVLCVYHFTDPNHILTRRLWLVPLCFFGYALTLTQSRGGFIALLGAVLALLFSRLGWRRGVPLAVVVLPLLFFAFEGRTTTISTSEGTGQSRIQLWSEGLSLFHETPLFGIGRGEYAEQVGHVAHNSFVHAYVEIGFFGGTFFFGAFALAVVTLWRLGGRQTEVLSHEVRRLRPYLMAIVIGYCTGMLSLSRCYVVPTYLILGLVASTAQVALPQTARALLPLSGDLVTRLIIASVGTVLFTEVYVRAFSFRG